MRHRSTETTTVSIKLSFLVENLSHNSFDPNRSYWAKQFHFEARVWDCPGLFALWRTVELFSMPLSGRAENNCQVVACWVQYEVPFFVCADSIDLGVLQWVESMWLRGGSDARVDRCFD